MKTALTITAIAAAAGIASAGTSFDANVTNNVIFGSGNANGSFTVNQDNGVELGLRAKVRFDDNNQPQNQFNSNGDGSYTFNAGLPPTGFGFAAGSTSTATWNFEFSINSDFEGTSGTKLSGLTYLLSIDFDPAAGVENFQSFDPINLPFADHAIGDNNTASGAGTSAGDATQYGTLIDGNNVAQNSWNMEFFDNAGAGFSFDGRTKGEYVIMLEAFNDEGDVVSMTSITVNVVPMPAAAGMAGLGLLAIGTRRRRA